MLELRLLQTCWAHTHTHTHMHTHRMIAGAPCVAALNSCSVNLLDSTTLTTHRLEPGILQHGSLPALRLSLPAGRGLISLCLFSSLLCNWLLCFRAHLTVFLLQLCLSLWPFSQNDDVPPLSLLARSWSLRVIAVFWHLFFLDVLLFVLVIFTLDAIVIRLLHWAHDCI